jgi:toxin ParE1/3/4
VSRFLLTNRARFDLDDIWLHVGEHNVRAADALVGAIVERCLLLAEFPGLGPSREELMPQLRSFPVEGYLIFYKPTPYGVEVVRVIHGSRDLEAIFQERQD